MGHWEVVEVVVQETVGEEARIQTHCCMQDCRRHLRMVD